MRSFILLRIDRRKGMIFKIDFEKTYDRVRWDFLEEVYMEKVSLRNGSIGLCRG